MAISPTVQQYQMQQEDVTPSQHTFDTKFGQSAYSTVKAKFPSLLAYIITFKVLESNLETGFGLGTFIIAKGNDIVYLPVVSADGVIESCEMVYDKNENSFRPLSENTIKQIIGVNSLSDFSIVKEPPYTENTQELFKKLIRPPASSNPVLASKRVSIAELPNKHKEKIASYLKDNPELLGKIAAFYPVEVLAEKLASIPEVPKTASSLPAVVSIDELTKDISEKLAEEQKTELLAEGYIITKEVASPVVLSVKSLASDLINNFNLTQVNSTGPSLSGTGYVCYFDGQNVFAEKCIIADDTVITKNGYYNIPCDGSIVICNYEDGISYQLLKEFGGVFPDRVTVPDSEDTSFINSCIFYPLKSAPKYAKYKKTTNLFPYAGSTTKTNINGIVTFTTGRGDKFVFDGNKKTVGTGYIEFPKGSTNIVVFPQNSVIIKTKAEKKPFINTVSEFYHVINGLGITLKLVNDGAGKTLINTATEKTAAFSKDLDLISHLVDTYSFSKEAVDKLLTDKEVIYLHKEAFTQPSQEEVPVSNEDVQQDFYTDINQAPQQPVQEFNPELIETSAELGDEDILDTGLLASVAGSDDIKTVLVDLLPEFSNTVTSLGQAILMLAINKKDLEDFYGSDQYHTLIKNTRKVFTLLGNIIADLNKYMSMH
jgi:hypothetical protein